MNTASTRTPEGQPLHCGVCHAFVNLEVSLPLGDAVCPNCGSLVWGTPIISPDNQGVRVDVRQPTRSEHCANFLRTLLDEWHAAGGVVWQLQPSGDWGIIGAQGESLPPQRRHIFEELLANVTTFGPMHLLPKPNAELNHPKCHRLLAAAGPFLVVEVLLRPDFQDSSIEAKRLELVRRATELHFQLSLTPADPLTGQNLDAVIDDLIHYRLRDASEAIEALSRTAQTANELWPGFLSFTVSATRAQAGVLWELTPTNEFQIAAIHGSIPDSLLHCVWHAELLREGLDVSPYYLRTPLGAQALAKQRTALLFSRVLRSHEPPLLLELVEPTEHQPPPREQVRFVTSVCKLVEQCAALA